MVQANVGCVESHSPKNRVYVVSRTTGSDTRALAPSLVEILQQKDLDHHDKVGTRPTGWGAETGFFVPAWGKLFVATRRQA